MREYLTFQMSLILIFFKKGGKIVLRHLKKIYIYIYIYTVVALGNFLVVIKKL